MATMERKISHTDKIFATLVVNGRQLAGIDGSNFGSLADVIRRVMALTGRWLGVAVLTVRNFNQGWSINLPLTFKPTTATATRTTTPPRRRATPKPENRQYVLPLFA